MWSRTLSSDGLEGALRESLLGDSSLVGEDSSRIGSQIDRRCCSRRLVSSLPPPAVPNALLGPTPVPVPVPVPRRSRSRSPPPSESRPMADELPASGQWTRPRSSAHPDQRACMVAQLSVLSPRRLLSKLRDSRSAIVSCPPRSSRRRKRRARTARGAQNPRGPVSGLRPPYV